MDHQVEALRKASVSQQLLGLRGVVSDVLHIGVVAVRVGRHPLVGDGGGALQDAVDDRFPVDRERQSAAYAHIQQRIVRQRLAVVAGDVVVRPLAEAWLQQHHAQARIGEHLHVGRLTQARQVRHRHLVDDIDFA